MMRGKGKYMTWMWIEKDAKDARGRHDMNTELFDGTSSPICFL